MSGFTVGALLLAILLFGVSGGETQKGVEGPVFISEPPSSRRFSNNTGAMVHCTAFGNPSPVLEWIKSDGRLVENIEGVIQVKPNSSLYFPPFADDKFRADVHMAKYRCVATNKAGTIWSREMSVKAVLAKTYRTYNVIVNSVFVTRGNTAVFKCTVNPYYVKEFIKVTSWLRSGKPVTPGERFRILPYGELHIRNVDVADHFQTYRCVIKNIMTNETTTSGQANLKVLEPINSAPEIEVISAIEVKEGENAELKCVANGYPIPQYNWFRDGQKIVLDHHRVSQFGGNLMIRKASTRDTGIYECVASNSQGTRQGRTSLLVKAPLSAFIEPSHPVIDQGRSVTINCTIYGHPAQLITWLKDGQPLVTNNRVYLLKTTVLHINDLQRHDEGMYQCLVSNVGDNAQGAAQVSLGVAKPVMLRPLNDQFVKTVRPVTFQCKTSGNPTPIIQWTLDDQPLPESDRIKSGSYVTSDGDVISHVNITNVKVEDGGQYRCTATNIAGSVSHVAKLHVWGIPYIRVMKNVTAVAGRTTVIRCHVAGYPIHTISWAKDGSNLPINHRQHVSKDGTLTIENVQTGQDEGTYTCEARNVGGQGMSRSLSLHVLEPPQIDPFHFPAKSKGDRVSVSCVVSRGRLPIRITWQKDGEPIPRAFGIMIRRSGDYASTLFIGNAQPKHNGNYTCTATNAAASDSYTAGFHVDVPPEWLHEPHDTFVILGRDLMVHCQSTGTPEPTITWKRARGDQPVDYQDVGYDDITGQSRTKQLPNGTLVISDATEEDHGYYLCQAGNGIGAALSKLIFLTVHVPAKFNKTETNFTVQAGQDKKMECFSVGDRPISISWSFNSKSLNVADNKRLTVDHFLWENGAGSSLVVTSARREDSGFYVCTAKNQFGWDSVMMQLIVQEKPGKPENIVIQASASRSVKISWDATFDGNCPILSYIVQYRTGGEPWGLKGKQISVAPNELSSVISNLHPARRYELRVLARNVLGVGEPSQVLLISTAEEEPTGPPTKVVVIATGSQSLKVTWKPPEPGKRNGKIKGYYIGYKKYNTSSPYIYITKLVNQDFKPQEELKNLEKFTKYAVHVQAYNKVGAGPKSDDVTILTLEDVPSQAPVGVFATPSNSQSIAVMWSPPPLYTLHGILQGYRVLYKPIRQDEDESDALNVTTNRLSVKLYGLEKFTNYSIEVLAYTRMGEGVRSPAIYIQTQQDIPERPADIKALAASSTSILVAWRPPVNANGLITKYVLLMRDEADPSSQKETRLELSSDQHFYEAAGLETNHKYWFRVSASTIRGEGEFTQKVSATPVQKVAARIASFPSVLYTPWQSHVFLDCEGVGDPAPSISWKKRGQALTYDDRIQRFDNGSIFIRDVQSTDAANYTCRAENKYGADEITMSLVVQAPPKQPHLVVVATTSSTIQISWRSGSNGGSKIQGFMVYYKREHKDWESVSVGPKARSFTAHDLRCGTEYQFHVKAFNKVGQGVSSETVTARTNGSAPIMPPQSMILTEINSTFVSLAMTSWQTGGCPITSYDIKYRAWNHDEWKVVENHISPKKKVYKVDLHPASWYVLKVTAYNDAGVTDCILKFATKTWHGATIQPVRIYHQEELMFWEKIHVMVPLTAAIVSVVVFTVAIALYCRRRQEKQIYKENASNLRRDLTAETSLMSELSKECPVNLDPSESQYSPEPRLQYNINILPDSDVNNTNEQNSGSDTSLNNAAVDEEGNIRPYATFEYASNLNMTSGDGSSGSAESSQRSHGSKPANRLSTGSHDRNSPISSKQMSSAETLQQPEELVPTTDPPKYHNLPRIPQYQNQDLILSPTRYTNSERRSEREGRRSRPSSLMAGDIIRPSAMKPNNLEQESNISSGSANQKPSRRTDPSHKPKVTFSPVEQHMLIEPNDDHKYEGSAGSSGRSGKKRQHPSYESSSPGGASSSRPSSYVMSSSGDYDMYDPTTGRPVVTPSRRNRNSQEIHELPDIPAYARAKRIGPPVPIRQDYGGEERVPLVLTSTFKPHLPASPAKTEDSHLLKKSQSDADNRATKQV